MLLLLACQHAAPVLAASQGCKHPSGLYSQMLVVNDLSAWHAPRVPDLWSVISALGCWQVEGDNYQLKPMNCPFHIEIYNHGRYSYRDLPLRWAELGTVYRYERSGTMQGLFRVRGFTQVRFISPPAECSLSRLLLTCST